MNAKLCESVFHFWFFEHLSQQNTLKNSKHVNNTVCIKEAK